MHNFGVGYTLNKHEFGADVTYLTAGGKLAYSDYSGEIIMKLNAYRLGLFYRYHFYKIGIGSTSNVSFYGELSRGITFSDLESTGYLSSKSGTENLSDKYLINSDRLLYFTSIGC